MNVTGKKQKRNIFELMVIFSIIMMLLISYHFFYLISYPDLLVSAFNSPNRCIIAVLLSIITLFALKKIYISKWMKFYMFMMFFSSTALIIFTIIEYPQQDLWPTIQAGIRFISPIFSIIFFYYLKENGTRSLFAVLNIISLIWCLIIFYQAIIWQFSGGYVFDFASMKTGSRDDSLRLGMGVFGPLMILYNFFLCYIKSKTKSFCHVSSFLVGIIALFLCDQTRALEVIISICLIFFIIRKGTNIGRNIITLCLVVSLLMLFSQTAIFSKFVDSFFVGNDVYSTTARLYGIEYYLDRFFNNPLFGNGLADEGEFSLYLYIVNGPAMMAHYNDLGFIGLLGNIGLFAIPFFIFPLCHFISITIHLKKRCSNEEYTFLLGLILYALLTSFTLILTDYVRMIVFSFYIGFFEYLSYREKDKKEFVIFD